MTRCAESVVGRKAVLLCALALLIPLEGWVIRASSGKDPDSPSASGTMAGGIGGEAIRHRLVPPFENAGGPMYVALLPAEWPSDTLEERTLSEVELWESGTKLGPMHSSHAVIKSLGGGRACHWEGSLYFSASDNTDPNTNGRSYVATIRRLPGFGEIAFRPRIGADPFQGIVRTLRECERTAELRGAPPGRPRLVYWFTIDSLRADIVGSTLNGRPVMPAVMDFARRSVSFARAYSQSSFTKISVSSMFTGLWPARHRAMGGVIHTPARTQRGDRGVRIFGLDPRFYTLPEYLADQGYETWSLVFTAHAEAGDGLLDGFDHLDLRVDGSDPVSKIPLHLFAYEHILGAHAPYMPSREAADALGLGPPRTIDPTKRESFAGAVNESQAKELKQAYAGEAYDADRVFARTMEWIRSQGLWDDALIILTADHGESFLEHAALEHESDLYEESVRVPLVVKFPKNSPAAAKHGSVIENRVRLIDLYPTIAEVIGGPGLPYPIDGTSLLPILDGRETEPQSRDVLMRIASTRTLDTPDGPEPTLLIADAVISGSLKAQMGYRPDPARNLGRPRYRMGDWYAELYDIIEDPRELHDLARARPKDLERLAAMALSASVPLAPPASNQTAPAQENHRELIEELRALGYVN